VGEQRRDHRGERGQDADHGQVAAGHGVGEEGVGREVEHGQQGHRPQQGRVVDGQAAPAASPQGADQGGGQGADLDAEGDPEHAAAGGGAAQVDPDEEQPEGHRRDQGEQDRQGGRGTAARRRVAGGPCQVGAGAVPQPSAAAL